MLATGDSLRPGHVADYLLATERESLRLALGCPVARCAAEYLVALIAQLEGATTTKGAASGGVPAETLATGENHR